MFVEVLLVLLSRPIFLNAAAGGNEKHCHVDGELTSKLSQSLAGKIAWYPYMGMGLGSREGLM